MWRCCPRQGGSGPARPRRTACPGEPRGLGLLRPARRQRLRRESPHFTDREGIDCVEILFGGFRPCRAGGGESPL
eukprot:7712159-Alexandrium_andersonii.AAC.2